MLARTQNDQLGIDLTGQVAIVTGAAQGIGRAFAHAFAGVGASVVVADRNLDQARVVAQECVTDGHQAIALDVDVTDPAAVADLVERTLDAFGRIDILVNNAAMFSNLSMKRFEDISVAEWNAVLAVNLTGVFLCCQAVAGPMRKQNSGRIINMSSATALFGRPNYLHYVASKAGVVGLTRGLAREMGEFGVTVNAVMPGSVETEVERESVTSAQVAGIVAAQSIHRRLTSADIIGTALFLASDAAGVISGQSIVVDGGANFV